MVKMSVSNNDESQSDIMSSDSSDEPDSDESSEMNESEIEYRRTEYNKCLSKFSSQYIQSTKSNQKISSSTASLEEQFCQLREQLYQERINQVEFQMVELKNGRSQEYLQPLQALLDTMNSRKEVAEILKNYRLENIKHKYDSEVQAALQHFESEKQLTYDRLNDEILEKIRLLEEDSHNVDINWADWGNSKSNKIRSAGRKKAVVISGPHLILMLREEEILEDWTAIRKAMAVKKTSTVAT